MLNNWEQSLAYVLQSEGGLVDDPRDPGGRTNAGVTQHTYDHWRTMQGLPLQDVADIAPDEESAIYKTMYWNPVLGDQLPSGVDYQVFDCAVNSGPYRAACLLQQALGVSVDGVIGPQTLAAAQSVDSSTLIGDFTDVHLDYLKTRPTWAVYGHGFTNRADAVESRAKSMTDAS